MNRINHINRMNPQTILIGLIACACLSLAAWAMAQKRGKAPAAPPVLAETISAKDWKPAGESSAVVDELSKQQVTAVAAGKRLTLEFSGTIPGSYVAEAVVRFPAGGASRRGSMATLACDGADEVYSVALSPTGDKSYNATILAGGAAPQPNAKAAGNGKATKAPKSAKANSKAAGQIRPQTFRITPRYPVEQISPTWDQDFRVGIENDMASLPEVSQQWLRLAIEVRPEGVRLYQNQMLLAEHKAEKSVNKSVSLTLAGEAHLASLEVRPIETASANSKYEPVRLDDICNANGEIDPASLPKGGQAKMIQDIPFIFPEANSAGDHVDVGRSLFRYRLAVGDARANSSPQSTWPNATELDPARIRLRVPNRAYSRIWVVAASNDDPTRMPVMTVRFYHPGAGFAVDGAASIPTRTVQEERTKMAAKLQYKTIDGKPASLWLVPIDIDAAALASEFRDQDAIDVEITKQVMDFRAFPDPAWVDYYQGGLPSAVQLYAMTLQTAPVSFIAAGAGKGVCNVYQSPDSPQWAVDVKNQSDAEQPVIVAIEVTDPYGQKSADQQQTKVAVGQQAKVQFEPKVGKFGLYSVKTTVSSGQITQSRTNTFLVLPPNERKATAVNSRWGLWDWNGGHKTNPNTQENLQLLKMLGALMGSEVPYEQRKEFGIGPSAERIKAPTGNLEDPAVYKQAVEDITKQVQGFVEKVPDVQYISPYAEWSLSLRLTHGVPPAALGLPPYDYTDKEKQNYQRHLLIVKATSEATRKVDPKLKVLFGVCGGIYSVPFMEHGYPKDMADGYGLDLPQFMRMPERQPRATEPSQLFFVKQAMKKYGYNDKQLVHFESYFPSSIPLTGGQRLSADLVVRTAALSMALGTDRFGRCWGLYDSGDYWGTQQYGCPGLMGRYPEFNPKPAAAAFATMTAMVDTATYDGLVPTGSFSSFCVRFKDPDKLIYCLWTIHGSRPTTLAVSPGASAVMVDENGNQSPVNVQDGKAQVTLTPTAFWLVVKNGEIASATSGQAEFAQAPAKFQRVLASFDNGGWNYSDAPNEQFAGNNWDRVRLPGKMAVQTADAPERSSKVVQVTLDPETSGAPLIGWYGTYQPAQPIAIPGKANALGLWVKGNSGWGRIIYEITDAKGETFQNIGSKDSWNCDDTHSWSYINFDGWRYMRFPLPGNAPGDDFREKDTVWWNHSGDGIVDLPIKLTRIIVEMPTQALYGDAFQPVKDRTIQFDDLTAEYPDELAMTDAPVKLQQAAAGMARPKAGSATLPNPLADLAAKGVGEPTQILDLQPPAERSDGTLAIVKIKPVEGAKEYQVWVSAYEDGRGAHALYKGPDTQPTVKGLKPDVALYFFVTWSPDGKQQSKPSPVRRIVTKDEFPFK